MEDDLSELVGPFRDAEGVARLLGVTETVVAEHRASGDLLACVTTDGRVIYPEFQFADDEVDPALLPAVRLLSESPDWAAAAWFVTPNDELDDHTPLAWGQAGRSTEAITRAAGHIARVWAA